MMFSALLPFSKKYKMNYTEISSSNFFECDNLKKKTDSFESISEVLSW